MKRILLTFAGMILLFLLWLFHPADPSLPVTIPGELPELNYNIETASESIRHAELHSGHLKTDNHARIIWNPDFPNRKAPCSMVYIHGFTASIGEGSPFHVRTARELGCHLYIARLHGHGRRTDEPLRTMNPDSIIVDAGRALAIGNLLGDQVILTGNSMGGLLAMHLAASHPESVDALVLLAPMLEFASPASVMFDKAWGQRLMRLIFQGSYMRGSPENDDHRRYWYTTFHIESLRQLSLMRKQILAHNPAENIRQPVFVGYYYKNDDLQDDQVSVKSILELENQLATPKNSREFRAFPDIDAHVISSAYRTRHHGEVSDAVIQFLKKNLPDSKSL